MSNSSVPDLIHRLQDPAAYPHSVDEIVMKQTHISWILLTGDFAYKIKKPVNFGFVDFSTLDKRRTCCEDEVRLNRRFAPELYLGVVPITREHRLCVDGRGEPVEYAVRMRQFESGQLLSDLLNRHSLTAAHMDELAETVAAFHRSAARSDEKSEWGSVDEVWRPVEENFEVLRQHLSEQPVLHQLDRLHDWCQQTHDSLKQTLSERQRDGFIRECHGDLHLGNLVIWQGRVTPFDCIEFNASLRWIDVMSEVAFLVMDLDQHGRSDLGSRFLNAMLEQSGDYAGLAVLPFYLVYRAMVRAKVDVLQQAQAGSKADRQRLGSEVRRYLDLAETYQQPPAPRLMITHGISGSGKTFGTQSLIERQRLIRIRSDVERQRLLGKSPQEAGVEEGIYSPQASSDTYNHLVRLARAVIRSGFSVIVDATFLKHAQRDRFRHLAEELKVPFQILAFDAHPAILRERIERRRKSGQDASEATVEVLEHQLRTREPLAVDEQPYVISPAAPDTRQTNPPDNSRSPDPLSAHPD